jgi:glycogen debranching enzyme
MHEARSMTAKVAPASHRPSKNRTPILILILLLASTIAVAAPAKNLELSRPARPWEFLPIVGPHAALLGNEAGNFEGWVYPLKILRNFHLQFHLEGRVIPADSLVRTIKVRPESATILYAGDTFQVQETLFVPVKASGAGVVLDVQTVEPLEIEAVFERDFQLEWPAALGGTYQHWDAALHAFAMGEETKQYSAYFGSPTASRIQQEYATNFSDSAVNSFLLGPTTKGHDTKLIVMAASVHGQTDAQQAYEQITRDSKSLQSNSADYYNNYLTRTVNLELPDAQLQQAYDWSRVSMLQGLVTNPYLGTGLIAGYRTSGGNQRPGFAWFFGRDSLWTDMALDAQGDFSNARTALDFLSSFQREDGKIPHEIAQTASLVSWFKNYPYGFASADATPLYIITMNDYVTHSGDVEFARQKWDSIWKAYKFLQSTWDANHLPQNFSIGHGWVEGGPLLPVNTELYQSALGAQAVQSLAQLAGILGKQDVKRDLDAEAARQKPYLNQIFWSPDKNIFSYALDRSNQRMDIPSVLATVPMWFGLLDQDKSELMLDQLSDSDHETDWGMRILSSHDPRYDPGGYHYGSVWPLFTGWASVGEYRYHRAFAAYDNLRANALLASDGSLGHVAEVLSGAYYQPLSTNSPHQIWSAAMVVSPLLKGMMGLDADALNHRLSFAPHVPADWNSFRIENLRVADSTLDLAYTHTLNTLALNIASTGDCEILFSPAFSLRTQIISAQVNGANIATHMDTNPLDQHPSLRFTVHKGETRVQLRLRNDFGLTLTSTMPPLGEASQGLRVVSEHWSSSHDALTLDVAGRPSHTYNLGVWNPSQLATVDGAELAGKTQPTGTLAISFPQAATGEYTHEKVVLHFVKP